MSYNIRIGIGMVRQTNLMRIAEVINKIQLNIIYCDTIKTSAFQRIYTSPGK